MPLVLGPITPALPVSVESGGFIVDSPTTTLSIVMTSSRVKLVR